MIIVHNEEDGTLDTVEARGKGEASFQYFAMEYFLLKPEYFFFFSLGRAQEGLKILKISIAQKNRFSKF